MRIAHINTNDAGGGAAAVAWMLHEGLRSSDIESTMLVGRRSSDSESVRRLPGPKGGQRLVGAATTRMGLNYVEYWHSARLARKKWVQDADVLHLHNLHGDYFGYPWLSKLTDAKPTVWTLHDMWAFTGHCSHSFDCERWRSGCGHCPYPDVYPRIVRDATALEWRIKRWVYKRVAATVVCPSMWLAELVKDSILGHCEIVHVPNGLNTSNYYPIAQSLAREALAIPHDVDVVLVVADNLSAYLKGGDLLADAIAGLSDARKGGTQREIVLATMGRGGASVAKRAAVRHLPMGYVSGDRAKALVYSAADVFVLPTRADNFPVVLQESMACGTPMVSFRVGGVPELVREGETGLLADPEDVAGLRDRIDQLLSDDAMRSRMAGTCRDIAVREYDSRLFLQRMITIYQSAIEHTRWS